MSYNNVKSIYYKEAMRVLEVIKKLERSELLRKAAGHRATLGITFISPNFFF